jgi:hypothetical protein
LYLLTLANSVPANCAIKVLSRRYSDAIQAASPADVARELGARKLLY